MLSTRVKDCMTAFVLCIRSSRTSLVCFLSMIAPPPRLSPKRMICCPSWLLVAATPAPLSGCSPRNLMQSGRISAKWLAIAHCTDRDSFEDCLREKDVIPTREERAVVRHLLAGTKHSMLMLKTDQPASYRVLC